MNNDLISREALKKEVKKLNEMLPNLRDEKDKQSVRFAINILQDIIDNAPTVEYPFYAEAYQTGYEEAKGKIIHSIAKQYSDHNELVPIWLSIGDIKGGVKNDT